MALWILKGWKIPRKDLKQLMQNPKSNILTPPKLTRQALGQDVCSSQQDQYIQHHCFALFIAGFPQHEFSYSAPMPKVDIIECKTEGATSAFLFALAMASENTTTRNISVFEELNINQLGLAKVDLCFDELLYI